MHNYRAIHHLWAIRYQLALGSRDIPDDEFVERELLSKFEAELDALARVEMEHRTRAETERDASEAEKRRICEEEEQAAAEREEVERAEEARRQALEKLAEEERAKEEQIRSREEMAAVRYEQRLRLGEELSAMEMRIAACLQKSEGTAQTLGEIRAGRAKCKCSRMIRKEISTLQGDVAALGEEVAHVAREEESIRAQEENQGGLIPPPFSDLQPGPVL
ncbi:hypothetical protein FA13DRAFT_1725713 [Coprinellus micaceus]|uniref:Uncharacterized protein n=1 Tax=Coprinellus micaceus TaxID=71717 RepID=A0A4Y7TV98_COPMI|nr:hypothetical protein FA13DRAFT_1725713 [Coprinellus micaceus]